MKYFGHEMPSLRHIKNRVNEYMSLLPEEESISKAWLAFDYIRSFLLYGCGAMDYFLYSFYDLNSHGKKKYLTVKQRVQYDYKMNTAKGVDTVLNKEKALVHFAPFINREWCGQQYHNSEKEYELFEQNHKVAIVKPIGAMGGSGVHIVNIPSIRKEGNTLYQYCKENQMLIEEIIRQHEKMNLIYAGCINTIRVVTVDGNCIGACLRIGTGGSKIDNAHAGGIFAEVDKETGIVISKAMNYKLKRFIRHPDTQTIIPGFEIPEWDKVLMLVKEASKLIPEVSLVGWDIAISTDGPTIVEVNHMPGMELIQAPNRHGVRYWMNNKAKI